MSSAPVILFVYNRPWHTEQTVAALKNNALADQTDLIIFSDGPKNSEDSIKVETARNYLRTINGFKSIRIVERKENLGLASSIISGVTEIINAYGQAIVLEDDIVTSRYFLEFMNKALERYKHQDKVMHISAYMFPIEPSGLPETFFIKPTGCWGWATWQRAWKYFRKDIDETLNKFTKERKRDFNLNNTYNHWSQILLNKKGRIDTWAVFWYASTFFNEGLSLHPSKSLTQNIGHDNSGVHCRKDSSFIVELNDKPIQYFENKLEVNLNAQKRLELFFKSLNLPLIQRLLNQ